jgi:predicted GTPase
MLTELKAAAVDVAARRALERGAEVVFVDNRPRTVGGEGEVDELLEATIRLAEERGRGRIHDAGRS